MKKIILLFFAFVMISSVSATNVVANIDNGVFETENHFDAVSFDSVDLQVQDALLVSESYLANFISFHKSSFTVKQEADLNFYKAIKISSKTVFKYAYTNKESRITIKNKYHNCSPDLVVPLKR
jgi:hypothetical protein